jgi:hypothetical protein
MTTTKIQKVILKDYNKKVIDDVTIYDVYESIRDCDYQLEVDQFKADKSNGLEPNKDKLIPAFMPHMVSETEYQKLDKAGDWSYNNLLHLDLDNIPTDKTDEVRAKLLKLNPLMLFCSPSGDGFKVFFGCDMSNFPTDKDLFRHVTKRWTFNILEQASLLNYYDGNVCRPNNLCYFSYDKDAYFSNESQYQTVNFKQAQQDYEAIQQKIDDKNKRIQMISKTVVSKGDSNIDLHQIVNSKCVNGINTADTITASVWGVLSKVGADYNQGIQALTILHGLAPNPNWQPSNKAQKLNKYIPLTGIKTSQVASNPEYTQAITDLNQLVLKLTKDITLTNPYVHTLHREPRQPLGTINIIGGLPSSGKSHKECMNILMMETDTITVYAVHDRKTLGSGSDSRPSMIEDLAHENNLDIPETYRVTSKDEDGNQQESVQVQLNDAVDNIKQYGYSNSVIFVTHKACELLKFDELLKCDDYNLRAVIDEVPSMYKDVAQHVSKADKAKLLSYFEYEEKDDYIEVSGLTSAGGDLLEEKTDLSNSKYKYILRESTKQNVKFVMSFEKKGHGFTMLTSQLMDASQFLKFDEFTIMGDDAQNSILVLLLMKDNNINLNIKTLPVRHKGISHRFDNIYYCTDQTYGSFKAGMNPDILNNIATEIFNKTIVNSEASNEDFLFLLNKGEQKTNTFIGKFNSLLGETNHHATVGNITDFEGHSKNITVGTSSTHGKNNLTHKKVVGCLYSLKGSPIQNAYLLNRGLTQYEIYRWTEYNAHAQNLFRGWLRKPEPQTASDRKSYIEKGTVIFPDLASFEYIVERVKENFGTDEADKVRVIGECFNNPIIEQALTPKKAGRKSKSGSVMNAQQRSKLSKWRNNKALSSSFVDGLYAELGVDIFNLKMADLKGEYEVYKQAVITNQNKPT